MSWKWPENGYCEQPYCRLCSVFILFSQMCTSTTTKTTYQPLWRFLKVTHIHTTSRKWLAYKDIVRMCRSGILYMCWWALIGYSLWNSFFDLSYKPHSWYDDLSYSQPCCACYIIIATHTPWAQLSIVRDLRTIPLVLLLTGIPERLCLIIYQHFYHLACCYMTAYVYPNQLQNGLLMSGTHSPRAYQIWHTKSLFGWSLWATHSSGVLSHTIPYWAP